MIPFPTLVSVTSSVSFADDAIVWSQVDDRARVGTAFGHWYFSMPPEWEIAGTHPDLLRVASFYLFGPWIDRILAEWEPSRRPGTHPGLAFSGGTDSTSAMLVMPDDTVLVYHERDFPSRLRHDNALRFFEHLETAQGRRVIRVRSDQELIRTAHGLKPGFTRELAVVASLVLCADLFELDAIATGTSLGTAWFHRGFRYRDYRNTPQFVVNQRLLERIGLAFWPVTVAMHGGLTQQMMVHAGFEDLAHACVRSQNGRGCNRCRKCFRTNARLGRRARFSAEVMNTILDHPMPAATYLQAVQAASRNQRLPLRVRNDAFFAEHLDDDLGFFDDYYPPAFDVWPEKYRDAAAARLRALAEPMELPYAMHDLDYYPGET